MKKALVMIGCSFIGAALANVALGIVGSKILMKIGKKLTKDGPIEVRAWDDSTLEVNAEFK